MAGIKNMYQLYGATPFDTIKGDTIIDRHMQSQLRQYTPYCKFCGREIINSKQDEHMHNVDPEWEIHYQMHYRCYRENVR
ncbi:hypothetical protein BK764_14235 [Bacillus thuringiensis serovar israelensis]|uniref:Uncharacterized protein n=1 Tax=Bacillus thuringiensis subsp. israelensis TaxID=1430 RepID=A0A160LKR9_BACTI|nr:hypothetical protein AS86_6674 [Bacillus thuringiensis HD1002]AND28598.1 hypothetical protein ATN07_33350 [Bacillus thuringiensis serovar israelensis]EAO57342.1 hypothetical protein RBTH_07114 [Bacillus thuringiensis serovar israelensis ATCC 35646]KRD76671.1 hypothetical protein ASE53_20510 [Bacillus sp. Root11]KRD82252.1 hypothetical protein ASE54_20040 [Bacillus sp. Root131]RCX38551.1 hypothetical protein DEU45_10641 [Bacillus sp. AG102]TBH91181.1 hypothetical protein D7S35_16580 [Bacill